MVTYGTTDRLTGGTASADSIHSETYSADKGCDNDDDTRWHSADTALPHWWKYDFGAGVSHAICKVSIKAALMTFTDSIWIKDFKVQGSNNDSDWTDLYTGQHGFNADYEDFVFVNKTKYRYLRIYITTNWNPTATPAGFFEMQAYEGIFADGAFFLNFI